jgi:uncharacterized protein involved in response to NO
MMSAWQRIFSYAFRPFFLLAGLYSVVAILIWILTWRGVLILDWQRSALNWHGHDMMMGLMAAAIAGFLLTAVANWTSRPPVSGLALAALVAAWLVGRMAMLSAPLSAAADAVFWLLLCLLLGRELLAARNKRNYKVLALLIVISCTDLLFHAAELHWLAHIDMRQVLWAQLWLVVLMINVIGGRIIPAFTGNWLRRRLAPGEVLSEKRTPAAFGLVDQLAISLLVLFVISIVIEAPAKLAAPLGLACVFMQGWRLLRWKFWLTFSDALVWMLHLSYAWLVAGIGLWVLALLEVLPVSAAVHALTIGAIASMIVSVAARAALGHTGRPLQSHPLLTSAIVLLSLASLSRILAAATGAALWLDISAALWMFGFCCFMARYAPILLNSAVAD